MKKLLITILIAIFFSQNFIATAQSPQKDDNVILKGLLLDIGASKDGLGLAFGFRYWFASLSIGVTGFANKLPKYSLIPPTGIYFNPNQPLPDGYVEDRYTGTIVTFDAGLHYEYFPWNFFANVGYFTQQDSVLAKEDRTDGRSPARYQYKVENSQGIAFGGGANYYLTDNLGIGLGLHTKRGVYAQIIYVWE